MRRIGLYLGFPPEGGGAFQYAQSVLAAVADLSGDQYEIVVAHSHSAWAAILESYNSKIQALAMREGSLEPIIRSVLRQGFPLALWRWLAPGIHPLTRRLLSQECDLWIFPTQDVLTYALPAKTIGAIHDLMHRHERRFPEVSSWGLFKRRERHYRNLCAWASAVLVDSRVGKLQVTEAYAIEPGHVHVLPYVAPDYIHVEHASADFDNRYVLPSKFIFYPAQFWEHKNHVRLLQALAMARESAPDLHLVLAGSKKNAYGKVVQTISELKLHDRVHLMGYVPDQDMPFFYRRARALIMPTFFGPTNIPPLEAMVTGCPMAVSDIYAMPEQVGDAALLFDPTSVSDIADAIIQLATDDALSARLSAAGKQRANRWGQAQFNARFRKIIQSTLALE